MKFFGLGDFIPGQRWMLLFSVGCSALYEDSILSILPFFLYSEPFFFLYCLVCVIPIVCLFMQPGAMIERRPCKLV